MERAESLLTDSDLGAYYFHGPFWNPLWACFLLLSQCLQTPQPHPVSLLSLHSPWVISLIPMASTVICISFKCLEQQLGTSS